MSLRRRPIETATYIPRSSFQNDNGFGLTSSGALGFSEDIENQLNTSCNACNNEIATSAGMDSVGKKKAGISCNRDAVASIRPFSSMMKGMQQSREHTGAAVSSFGFDEDEDEDMVHTGVPMSSLDPRVEELFRHAKNDNADGFKKRMERLDAMHEMEIENAYAEYSSFGRYKNIREIEDAVKRGPMTSVPQRIFSHIEEYDRSTHSTVWKKMTSDQQIKLNEMRAVIKEYWKKADSMDYKTFNKSAVVDPRKNKLGEDLSSDHEKMRAKYYHLCMEKYREAAELVKGFERTAGNTMENKVSQKNAGGKNTQKLSPASSMQDSSSLSSIRAMLQQKTRDLQMKIGAKMHCNDNDEEGENMYCSCAEPQPVPMNHLGESMYCTCDEPEPVSLGESMYCTCETPVPMLRTADNITNRGRKEYNQMKRLQEKKKGHDHQNILPHGHHPGHHPDHGKPPKDKKNQHGHHPGLYTVHANGDVTYHNGHDPNNTSKGGNKTKGAHNTHTVSASQFLAGFGKH